MKDPCIRQLLRDTKLSRYINDNASKVVEELSLPVAKARIDIAVINGHLHGFEIKSASDTLQRLPFQIEAYTKVFDYLSIVTEEKYCDRILDIAPPWVGVLLCSEKNRVRKIKYIRKPKRNYNTENFYLAKLLWREELIEILVEYKIKFRKKDRNWILCEELASNFDTTTLSMLVRNRLKNRCDWKENYSKLDNNVT